MVFSPSSYYQTSEIRSDNTGRSRKANAKIVVSVSTQNYIHMRAISLPLLGVKLCSS